jgi:hypothetical protein
MNNSSFDASRRAVYEYANLFLHNFEKVVVKGSPKIGVPQQIAMQRFSLLCCSTFDSYIRGQFIERNRIVYGFIVGKKIFFCSPPNFR